MQVENFQQWLAEDPEDIQDWLKRGLNIGMDKLNLETGIVSNIDHNDYVIKEVASSLGNIFSPGDEFELKNTYCEAVAKNHKTITYIQVGAIPEMRIHPVYQAVQLESYIGAPIYDQAENVIGTVNFTSHAARQIDFQPDEIEFVNQMAKKIQDVILNQ